MKLIVRTCSQRVLQLFLSVVHAVLVKARRTMSFSDTILPTSQPLAVTIHLTAGARYIVFGKPGGSPGIDEGGHIGISTAFTFAPHLVGFRVSISAILNHREL